MRPKTMMLIAAGVGSTIGSLVPSLWGASPFSGASLIFSALGTIAGIWLVFKLYGY